MGVYAIGQTVFALACVLWGVRALRRLFEGMGVDPRYEKEVARRVRQMQQHPEQVRALAVGKSWSARLLRAALEGWDRRHEGYGEVSLALAEEHAAIRDESVSTLRMARNLGRIATAIGVLGACVQWLWLTYGSHGLAALAAGVAEREAGGRATLSILLGAAVGALALGLRARLRGPVRERLQAAAQLRRRLEAALEPEERKDRAPPEALHEVLPEEE